MVRKLCLLISILMVFTLIGNVSFAATKIPLSKCTIGLSSSSFVYDGTIKKPTVTVKYKNKIVSNSNYTVKYNCGKKIGTYSVKVTGKNNYTGTRTLYYTITGYYYVKFIGDKTLTQKIQLNKTVALYNNTFEKTGYTFAGWAKSKTGKAVYTNKQKVKNLTTHGKTVYLYPIWTKETTYRALVTCSNDESGWPKTTEATYFKNIYCSKMNSVQYMVGQSTTTILDKIETLAEKTESEDISLIYIAGHGNSNGIYTSNTSYISPAQLRDACDKCEGRIVLFINSCFGGTTADNFWKAGTGSSYAQNHFTVITTINNTESFVGDTDYWFNATLSTLDTNKDSKLQMSELYKYAKPLQYQYNAKWAATTSTIKPSYARLLGNVNVVVPYNDTNRMKAAKHMGEPTLKTIWSK